MMHSTASSNPRRYLLPLLLAYPVLAIAGALTHWQVFPLLALTLLLTMIMLPRLLAGRIVPWLIWVAMLLVLLALSLVGLAVVVLECVPVFINAMLAWWFGRTLSTPPPLVARFIAAIEGPQRLQQAGIAAYARGLTWFWTLLLATQAVVMFVLLMCATRVGLLAQFGLVSPLVVAERLAALWLHLGSYLLLATALLLEYGYRRWHLRHLAHPSLHQLMLQVSLNWPQLLRGKDTNAP